MRMDNALRADIEQLWSDLLAQIQQTKDATVLIGAERWRVLVRLVDAYLEAHDDPEARAARRTLVRAGTVALGDGLAVLDRILRKWPAE